MERKRHIKLFLYIFFTFSLCLSFSIMLVEELLFEDEAQSVALHNAVKKSKERKSVFKSYLNKSENEMLAMRNSFFFNQYLYSGFHKQALESLFYTFASSNPFVLSIRFIDRDGQERIKVARFPKQPKKLDVKILSKPYKISQYELKNRSQASYFTESKVRAKNEVWFSNIDLNLKKNGAKHIYAPTMETILPVKYRNEFAGVFIVEHMMGAFLKDVANAPLYDMILFNDNGDIIYHYLQKKCENKRCVTQLLGKHRNIADDFPEYAQQILQTPLLTTDKFVSAKFSLPIEGGMNIVFQLNETYIQQQQKQTYKQYLATTIIVFILSIILTYIIIKQFHQKLTNIEQLNKLNESLNDASKIAKIGFWEAYDYVPSVWNAGAYDIFEIDNRDEPLSEEKFQSFLSDEDYIEIKRHFESSLKHKTEYFFTHQIVTEKKNIKYIEVRAKHVFDDHGDYIKSIGSIFDVTHRKHAEELLRTEKDKLETIFETVLEGICVLNLETKYEYFNKNYLSIVECSEDELRESNFYDWVMDEGRDKATTVFKDLFRSGIPQNFERDYVTRDGKRKRLSSSVALMPDKRQILMTTIDNTKLYNTMLQIKEQSITDDLTHLHNRKAYQDKVEELLIEYKRYTTTFSMMMIDIDFFKSVNDVYGHPVGDKVLVALSKLIRERIRKCDFAYRIGGEEFIVLLPNTDIQAAYVLAEQIRVSVLEDLDIIKNRKITISIGLVEADIDDTESAIFKRVDDQLYVAKRSGRNRVSVESKH